MRIKSLHIDSFGKLSNFDLNFDSGLNTMVADNGFGKTTISVFIKCMFYGIKGGNKAGLNDNNERLKYLTWGTTKLIGGSITFEINNKEYTIERYFGEKPSQDTFKLIDRKTNKESIDYSLNIGEEIFGIDADAFERTTYIPQKENVTLGNLITKITTLLGGTEDLNSIDDIIKNVDDSAKKYYKTGGKSGYIADSKKNINDLEIKIRECENYEKIASDLSVKITEANTNITMLNEKLSNIKPLIEKAIKSDTLAKEYNTLLQNIEKTKNRYLELESLFSKNDTSIEVIDGLITLNNELIKIDSKIDTLKSNIEALDLDKYNSLFVNNPPALLDIDKHIESNSTTQETFTLPPWFIVIVVATIAITAISFALYTVSFALGIILTILGVTGGLVELYYYLSNKKQPTNTANNETIEFLKMYGYTSGNIVENLQQLKSEVILYTKLLKMAEDENNKILNLEASKIKIVDAIVPYLHRYYNQINDDYGTLLYTLRNDYIEYSTLTDTLKEYEDSLKKYNKNIDSTLDLNKLREEENLLTKDINALSLNRQDLLIKRDNYLEKANLKQDLIQELSIENERLLALHDKYNTLLATSKYIKLAKDEMCSKYLSPITNSMSKYLDRLSPNNNLAIGVDTDLKLHIIENTISHDLEYYSRGYKDLFDLCFRFAIIDTIFKTNTPFVILDDPFVNIDDNKLNSIISSLKELSKEYQIIYMTCSNNRK